MKGAAIRYRMNGIEEAPGKTWFWELAAAVIDAGRCVQCGACVAACPTDSIGVNRETNLPELVKMCTGCSLCWDFCPRGGLRYESLWPPSTPPAPTPGSPSASAQAAPPSTPPAPTPGSPSASAQAAPPSTPPAPTPGSPSASAQAARRPVGGGAGGEAEQLAELDWKLTGGPPGDGLGAVLDAVAARAVPPVGGAQDGGVVSAVLAAALEAGDIDGAVVSRPSDDPDEPWKGVATVVTTPEEVQATSGSFYNQTMALAALDLSRHRLPPRPRLAVVGTPCEVQGLRAMQARPWATGVHRVEAVVLTIALLCTKSFDYEGLMLRELRDRRGLDLSRVSKVDITRGRMQVECGEGNVVVDEPVRAFHGAALKGCDECADFLGRSADLSVGSVGSAAGWSSVLVRSEAGRRALERAGGALELRQLDDPPALLRLDALDKRIAEQSLQRRLDPDAPLFIDFAEHLRGYAGSDRAPSRRE